MNTRDTTRRTRPDNEIRVPRTRQFFTFEVTNKKSKTKEIQAGKTLRYREYPYVGEFRGGRPAIGLSVATRVTETVRLGVRVAVIEPEQCSFA